MLLLLAQIASLTFAAQSFTHESSQGTKEICEITTFPGVKYSNKEIEKMKKLCQLDWHAQNKVWERKEQLTSIALCPKLIKTSPALEFFSLNSDTTRTEAEDSCEDVSESGKKFAKFKVSISCAYSPNILAYAHFSRFFDMFEVPLSVYRTYDKKSYLEYVKKGHELTINNETWLGKNWKQLLSFINSNHQEIISNDKSVAFGAFSETIKGEEVYNEFTGNDQRDYLKSESFKLLKERKSLALIYPKTIKNLGKIYVLKDFSDMLILDALMSQYDRYGNVHYYKYYYYLKDGKLKREKEDKDDLEQESRMSDLGAVLFKRAVLKDNDCGIRFQNLTLDHGGLKKIRHLSSATYQKLLEFEKLMSEQAFKTWLKTDLHFVDSDIAILSNNLSKLLGLIRPMVNKGEILLDLNPEEWAINP